MNKNIEFIDEYANIYIKTNKFEEAGYTSAMFGLAKSYKISVDVAKNVAMKLFKKDGGHNKFLEQIILWIDVRAPRYFWQEADTYRIGTSKQSESTMHTLIKEIKKLYPLKRLEPLFCNQDNSYKKFEYDYYNDKEIVEYINYNFEGGWHSISVEQWYNLCCSCYIYEYLPENIKNRLSIINTKQCLPESFLQSRIWMFSYKTLRNMLFQRYKHILPHWKLMIDSIINQADHPEFLQKEISFYGDINLKMIGE